MPAAIVDSSIPAQGTIPQSPISSMLSKMVGVYGQQFPTPLERSELQYRNAETQHLQQQMSGENDLGNVVRSMYAPTQPQPPALPAGTDASVLPADMKPSSAPPLSRDQIASQNIPGVVDALSRSGQIGQLGGTIRALLANAPGETAVSDDPKHPSPVSMAMMGAGDAYTSTPDAALTGATPGQRDRNAKINSILQNNPNMDRQRAANIVDNVFEYPQDPNTKNIFEINKATGDMHVLKTGNQQVTQNNQVSSPGTTPAAAPGPNTNNPFNLRPVGSSTGFQTFNSPQEGVLAGIKDLGIKLSGQSQAMGGKPPTLRNIISTYSPPNENATNALVANAAARMKVDPDQVLGPQYLMPLAEAVLAQEGNNGTAKATTPGAQNAAVPTTPAFSMKRGDLGIPFDQIYGGGAQVNKATGAVSALLGSNDANSDATSGLQRLNSIKNQLIAINNQRPGMRANAQMQANYTKQFPDADPQLHDLENGLEQGVVAPGTAEDTWNKLLADSVSNRTSDAKMLDDPNASAEERQAAKMRVDNTDKLFAGLPESVQQAYQKASGLRVSAPTNLERGQQETAAPVPGKDGKIAVVGPDGNPYRIPPASLPALIKAGGKVRSE